MIISFFYLVLALLGLGFLILIHELGHYYMAKRVGMHVETFSIGLGKPLVKWERDGTQWQIGWLLFGGYVKIAGTDTSGDVDPYTVSNGFFGKKPWDRILVAVMGPIVNLVFAIIAFAMLWALGGRDQTFAEHTHKIGWVDPQSALYTDGVRPGDEISAYNGHPFTAFGDHLYAPLTSDRTITVSGLHIDYKNGARTPFQNTVGVYPYPNLADKGLMTAGILKSANYLIYGDKTAMPPNSSLINSGIESGDRIVWVDGELVFSSQQLSSLLNDNRVLLTVVRSGKQLLKRVPRVEARELKLDPIVKDELTDWQFEGKLQGTKLPELYIIPYSMTAHGVVEAPLRLIDRDTENEVWPSHPGNGIEEPLQEGDKIIAINGQPITHTYQLLQHLQNRLSLIIVERSPSSIAPINWRAADAGFDNSIQGGILNEIIATIGDSHVVKSAGPYLLLNPVVPEPRGHYLRDDATKHSYQTELADQQRAIDAISDPDKRAIARKNFEHQQQELVLGLPNVQDRRVWYNPSPLEMFGNVFNEIARTLGAIVSGTLSPKWISGPVGIIQAVHDSSMSGLSNALFWLGAISLNLGILNLLPIPVLDGGSILLSLFEMVTGRRLKPKTMEKLILPFAVMLIGFFIFITFNDISRIFKNFWS